MDLGPLFSDYKAVNLGDAITIIVVESSEASNACSKINWKRK